MFLGYHPAAGLGDLLPGSFVVPQNPIEAGQVKYIPKIGDILPARFAVPQNPLIAALRKGVSGLGGCCCGGEGSKGANPEDTGMAYINGEALAEASGDVLGSIDWVTVIIAAGAAYMLAKR